MTTVAEFQPHSNSLSSPDQVAWARACALAADRLSATVEPQRLAKGLALAQAQKVCLSLDDKNEYATVKSGRMIYTITTAGQCPCQDNQLRKATCKHLLAVDITQGASVFFDHEQELVQQQVTEREALSEVVTQALQTLPQVPSPQIRLDNPAGFNLKDRVGTMELWYTLHDTDDEALLARLKKVVPLFQAMVRQCREVDAALKPAPPVASVTGTGLVSTQNGSHPPEHTNDTDRSWCPHHKVVMDFYPSNERGTAWYSHRLGNGGYCRGGN